MELGVVENCTIINLSINSFLLGRENAKNRNNTKKVVK